jgi:Tfp pilus assembly protein PilX
MTPADATQSRQVLRPHRGRQSGAKGVALVITLLLLRLLTALTLAMVLAVSSDTLINGYYQSFRGAFYAADSGLNIGRQNMVSQVAAAVPATFNVSSPPIPAGTDSKVQAAILSSYGSKTSINSGQAANSWLGSFTLTSASLQLVSSPAQPVVSTDKNGNVTGYQYTYNYSFTSVGQALGGEQTTLTDSSL